MTGKNKDITHILRLVTIPLILAVMMSAGAIGCVNGGGGGCCCGCCGCGQPGIEVSKTVWNPISEEWVEEITANVGDIVRFNCTIHNNGTIYDWDCCNCNCDCCNNGGRKDCCNCNCNCCNCYNLTNITVLDVLPDGLAYVINSATSDPTYVSTDNRTVGWEFPDRTLEPCDSITIEFNARVVKCVESVNRVNVSAWYKQCVCEDGYCGYCCCCCGDCDGCGCEDVKVSDEDTATVVCTTTPPPPSIDVDKTVWNGAAWVDSTYAGVGETVRFRCIIHNSGTCCNLTDITVWDMLPESLEYANDATPTPPTYISPDNITIRWEFPDLTLEPCENITIEFNASVIDCVESVNHVDATAWYDEIQVSDEDTATVVCTPTPPPVPVPIMSPIGTALLICALSLIGAGVITRRG